MTADTTRPQLAGNQLGAGSVSVADGLDVHEGSLDSESYVEGVVGAARITKVGLWLTLLTLVLSVAAANTGNNSLYLVIAASFSLLIVAWWAARSNVRGLTFGVAVPDEVFAGSPAVLDYTLRRKGGGKSTDLLLLIDGSRSGSLVRFLAGSAESFTGALRRFGLPSRPTTIGRVGAHEESSGRDSSQAVARGQQQILYLRRGLHQIGQAKALSLFPMGLFRRQVTFKPAAEVIVLPEIFSGLRTQTSLSPRGWRHSGSRVGRSEDLHSLRDWRQGDDPRSIHWKQSARNSRLIYQERSEDEARRVSIVVDSLVPADVADDDQRFERLVSEAATACVEYLGQGYEVELRLREGSIGFGSGGWQRRRVLEALALLQWQTVERATVGDRAAHEASDGLAAPGSGGADAELRFSLRQSWMTDEATP